MHRHRCLRRQPYPVRLPLLRAAPHSPPARPPSCSKRRPRRSRTRPKWALAWRTPLRSHRRAAILFVSTFCLYPCWTCRTCNDRSISRRRRAAHCAATPQHLMKNEWMVVCNGTSRACKDFKGPILILGAALFKDKVVRPVTSWLNEHGHRTRVGARWGIGPLHKILARATYKGLHRFNRKVWKGARRSLKLSRLPSPSIPSSTRQRSTPSSRCATCSGGMTLRTGKSGRYRYYTCATCAQQGKAACKGRSIPMDKLDRLVTERLANQLLTLERVGKILGGLMDRQAAMDEDHSAPDSPPGKARRRRREARAALCRHREWRRPADAILKDRVAAVKTERDIAQVTFDRAVAEMRPASGLQRKRSPRSPRRCGRMSCPVTRPSRGLHPFGHRPGRSR